MKGREPLTARKLGAPVDKPKTIIAPIKSENSLMERLKKALTKKLEQEKKAVTPKKSRVEFLH